MRFGVVVFPGTNCDADTRGVLERVFHTSVESIWHASTWLPPIDCVILPGGFSYGDYLRAGAIARFAPVMSEVARFAAAGGLVLGICNGFQILCEAGLLPGALLPNDCLQFRCGWTHLRVESTETPFTAQARRGQVLRMPIAHGEGRYYADGETLARLQANDQIILRYCAPDGSLDPRANPNGSLDAIAGICNEARNVFGLMPHPERCCEDELGGADGRVIFESILQSATAGKPLVLSGGGG
ncbi:MAG TPA: phosphoribosylformylglycinamidine synthase subunit PurQ [Chloroflexota bacterium]|nr:phosphoribosylformylglycinamidine synthase subunit PurQ [Chloroflexota bacterium]